MVITDEAKEIIENNPIAIATVMPNGNPNVIGVACVQVIEVNKLLVTDVYMNQTLVDIAHNPRVTVIAWNKEMTGYKLIGIAQHFTEGEYIERVKTIPENAELQPKGALVITVEKVIKTA